MDSKTIFVFSTIFIATLITIIFQIQKTSEIQKSLTSTQNELSSVKTLLDDKINLVNSSISNIKILNITNITVLNVTNITELTTLNITNISVFNTTNLTVLNITNISVFNTTNLTVLNITNISVFNTTNLTTFYRNTWNLNDYLFYENSQDPTYNDMKNFIATDKTNENTYNETYNCWDFSRDIILNSLKQHISIGLVYIEWKNYTIGHAIIIFNTTDKGRIFIEPQNDEEVNTSNSFGFPNRTIELYQIIW